MHNVPLGLPCLASSRPNPVQNRIPTPFRLFGTAFQVRDIRADQDPGNSTLHPFDFREKLFGLHQSKSKTFISGLKNLNQEHVAISVSSPRYRCGCKTTLCFGVITIHTDMSRGVARVNCP